MSDPVEKVEKKEGAVEHINLKVVGSVSILLVSCKERRKKEKYSSFFFLIIVNYRTQMKSFSKLNVQLNSES